MALNRREPVRRNGKGDFLGDGGVGLKKVGVVIIRDDGADQIHEHDANPARENRNRQVIKPVVARISVRKVQKYEHGNNRNEENHLKNPCQAGVEEYDVA
jgi:hypothetical protein